MRLVFFGLIGRRGFIALKCAAAVHSLRQGGNEHNHSRNERQGQRAQREPDQQRSEEPVHLISGHFRAIIAQLVNGGLPLIPLVSI
jgi:hypothetical protein